MYQLHGGLGLAPDVEAALAELRGQSREVLRDIVARYARMAHGHSLERDLVELGSPAQRREALTLLGPVLPLVDHLKLSIDYGWTYNSMDQEVMLATLRARVQWMTPEERRSAAYAVLEEAAATPGALFYLRQLSEVRLALGGLGLDHSGVAFALLAGEPVRAARLRIRRALGAVNIDEGEIVAVLLRLSPADRARVCNEDAELCHELRAHTSSFDHDLGPIVRTILDAPAAAPPVQAVIDWALGGAWDGTKSEALRAALKALAPERLATYRLGYVVDRGRSLPAGVTVAEASAARSAFSALDVRLQAELGYDEYQQMLDVLLHVPTLGEWKTEHGRVVAAAVIRLRALERAAPREAAFGDAPTDWIATHVADVVSSTGPLADEALIRFEQAYAEATADATIHGEELAILAALGKEHTAAQAASVATVDTIAWLGSMAAATGTRAGAPSRPGIVLGEARVGIARVGAVAESRYARRDEAADDRPQRRRWMCGLRHRRLTDGLRAMDRDFTAGSRTSGSSGDVRSPERGGE